MTYAVSLRILSLLLTPALVLALTASPAAAKNCGDTVAPCACGDTVTASWTFTQNLTCGGTGPALTIGNNGVVINGTASNGTRYTLTGTGSGQLHKGIRTAGFDNTVIKNLNVSGFNWGINVEASDDGRTWSENTLIDNVYVTGADDEGIHLGEPSSYTTIQNSELYNNGDVNCNVTGGNGCEQLYLKSSYYNTIKNTKIHGTGPNVAIRDKGGYSNTFTSNTIKDKRVELDTDTVYDCFGARDANGACISGANTLTNSRFSFKGESANNTVWGATIDTAVSSCVEFEEESSDNFVRATLKKCKVNTVTRDIRAESVWTNTFHKGACSNPNPVVYPPENAGLVNIECCDGCC